jgi:hypothetical protein
MRMITRPHVPKVAMATGLPKNTCLCAPKSATFLAEIQTVAILKRRKFFGQFAGFL